MRYDIGAMVHVRQRDWVVLPDSSQDFVLLKPLGGSDLEVTGIYVGEGGETLSSAQFGLPNPQHFSGSSSARLLSDAARLAIRSGAGPFRSLGRLGFEPRPYQLVPLMMALRLEPVRLLIADDVGIGKTIEAGMIARELLDRGEVERLAVVCPPHLAEQWQAELSQKFGIEATLVLSHTRRSLERQCMAGESLFERFKHVIVSIDFIKAPRQRQDFLRHAPELILVDEAHTCAEGGSRNSKRQQRYQLLEELSQNPQRHVVLITATPHSGKAEAFSSLLKLLEPDFANLPPDLSGTENEKARIRLAQHLVQRKRADIRSYNQEDTPFPERESAEIAYQLHPEYLKLFDEVLDYARESIERPDPTGKVSFKQRLQWWSALALLRSMASSPAAAHRTLSNRAGIAEQDDDLGDDLGENPAQNLAQNPAQNPSQNLSQNLAALEHLGRELVLDPLEDSFEMVDTPMGAATDQNTERLRAFAVRAEGLYGKKDHKLSRLILALEELRQHGHQPIVFCRFIDTAVYVAKALQDTYQGRVQVEAVTGQLSPDERERKVRELSQAEARVLVATDCLSEGINLQGGFDAIVHYDLPWNPNRLEQREGRVDRYGQAKSTVRVITLYGSDNRIDGIVLDVLLRKHREIAKTLGISVPAPEDSEDVFNAILQGVLLREGQQNQHNKNQEYLFDPKFQAEREAGLEADTRADNQAAWQKEQFFLKWQNAADQERRSRSRFAQNAIRTEEVALELAAAKAALGDVTVTQRLVEQGLRAHGVVLTPTRQGSLRVALPAASEVSGSSPNSSYGNGVIQEMLSGISEIAFVGNTGNTGNTVLQSQYSARVTLLGRNHRVVEQLSSQILGAALEDEAHSTAKRVGAMLCREVNKVTTLLLLRHRFHIQNRKTTRDGTREWQTLAEELDWLAFEGSGANLVWLEPEATARLLSVEPSNNLEAERKQAQLERSMQNYPALETALLERAEQRSRELLEAHKRVRSADSRKGGTVQAVISEMTPPAAPDVLGWYVFLPDLGAR